MTDAFPPPSPSPDGSAEEDEVSLHDNQEPDAAPMEDAVASGSGTSTDAEQKSTRPEVYLDYQLKDKIVPQTERDSRIICHHVNRVRVDNLTIIYDLKESNRFPEIKYQFSW